MKNRCRVYSIFFGFEKIYNFVNNIVYEKTGQNHKLLYSAETLHIANCNIDSRFVLIEDGVLEELSEEVLCLCHRKLGKCNRTTIESWENGASLLSMSTLII